MNEIPGSYKGEVWPANDHPLDGVGPSQHSVIFENNDVISLTSSLRSMFVRVKTGVKIPGDVINTGDVCLWPQSPANGCDPSGMEYIL
jgi:hypothetical protein